MAAMLPFEKSTIVKQSNSGGGIWLFEMPDSAIHRLCKMVEIINNDLFRALCINNKYW
ncbi:MAG: hypothetical protein ACOYJB_05215 [Christensenellaceae bacterium]|jgi:hypothetical protein